jgi:hypothetical protein
LNKNDIIFQNWKKSGFHEGMDETFAKSMKFFTNSTVLLYMPPQVPQVGKYREATRLYVGDFSDKAFCESLGSKSTQASTPKPKRKGNHDAD